MMILSCHFNDYESHTKEFPLENSSWKKYIKNIDSFDIKIGEILDFEKNENFNKFSIRKQIFAIKRIDLDLKELSQLPKLK